MVQTDTLSAELTSGLPAWAKKKVSKSRLGLYWKKMFFYNVKYGGNILGLICYFRDHLPKKIGEEYYQDSSGTIRFRCRLCNCLMDIGI